MIGCSLHHPHVLITSFYLIIYAFEWKTEKVGIQAAAYNKSLSKISKHADAQVLCY